MPWDSKNTISSLALGTLSPFTIHLQDLSRYSITVVPMQHMGLSAQLGFLALVTGIYAVEQTEQ
jgi:hypothetical protein